MISLKKRLPRVATKATIQAAKSKNQLSYFGSKLTSSYADLRIREYGLPLDDDVGPYAHNLCAHRVFRTCGHSLPYEHAHGPYHAYGGVRGGRVLCAQSESFLFYENVFLLRRRLLAGD